MCILFGSSFGFLCVDLKLKMIYMGMDNGCVIVVYLGCRVEFGVVGGGGNGGGCVGVWYVCSEKTIVTCKNIF